VFGEKELIKKGASPGSKQCEAFAFLFGRFGLELRKKAIGSFVLLGRRFDAIFDVFS
jgi:hypothetical protein